MKPFNRTSFKDRVELSIINAAMQGPPKQPIFETGATEVFQFWLTASISLRSQIPIIVF